MRRLTSIVAVNRSGVIGCGNTLPWRLKTDMRFFRETTTGNVVLMGRKTFDSLGRKCLPQRFNVVVSHSFNLFPETAECRSAGGIPDALFRATLAPRSFKEAYVIGGASMYEQFAPYVDRYLITLVEKAVPDGDTFFEQDFLGNPDEWHINQLRRIEAGPDDEAAFSIFEVLARDPEAFLHRRLETIEAARSASTRAKHSTPSQRSTREGRAGDQTYSML
ncbi:MAG: dihydrofolate reductase [Pseudomonadota bacterium]|nr:dihydrofolate reductase [Pseudomonadota bacterium]